MSAGTTALQMRSFHRRAEVERAERGLDPIATAPDRTVGLGCVRPTARRARLSLCTG
jgi:hypothetical protein